MNKLFFWVDISLTISSQRREVANMEAGIRIWEFFRNQFISFYSSLSLALPKNFRCSVRLIG